MLARRPFGTTEALLDAARTEWFSLPEEDWKEAFGHHPMIGDREALRRRFAGTQPFSEREQAGVESSPVEVLDALTEGNRQYFEKFGRYTRWSADDLRARGIRASWSRLLLRPWLRFARMYVLEGGFRAGRRGIVLCMLAAFSVFTKYARRWEDEVKGEAEPPSPPPPSAGRDR